MRSTPESRLRRFISRALLLCPVLAAFAQQPGMLDLAFAPPELSPQSSIYSIVPLGDGKILLGGNLVFQGDPARYLVARLNSDGSLDPTFQVTSGRSAVGIILAVQDIVLQKNGGIVVAGTFTEINGVAQNGLARLKPDGGLDRQFAPQLVFAPVREPDNFNSLPPQQVRFAEIQLDDKLLIAGAFTAINGVPRSGFARLNQDGSLDASFNPDIKLFDSFMSPNYLGPIQVQPDGKILLVAETARYRTGVMRLTTTGTKDNGFAVVKGNGPLALQSDGKVVLTSGPAGILRLHRDGSVDSSFDIQMGPDGSLSSLLAQPDGKVLIGGYFANVNGIPRIGLARLNTDGSLDSFDIGSTKFEPSEAGVNYVTAVALQGDGKVVVAGRFTRIQGHPRQGLARLLGHDLPGLPIIHTQPKTPKANLLAGDEITLRVGVASYLPAAYQWQFNGEGLLDATNATLTLKEVQLNQTGSYRVVVSNPAGRVISEPATVVVIPSGPLGSWTVRHQRPRPQPPHAHGFFGYGYGAKLHVIVGDEGLVMTSPDRNVWTRQNSGTTSRLTSVINVNGNFYAAGYDGTILHSADGVTWNHVESVLPAPNLSGGAPKIFVGLAYGNGTFAAMSAYDQIFTSTDGQTWRTPGGGAGLGETSIAFGNGEFVTVGNIYSPAVKDLRKVIFADGRFVAVGLGGIIQLYTNGINWSPQVSGTTDDLTAVGYGAGLFVASGAPAQRDPHKTSTLLTSPDGVNWTRRSSPSLFAASEIGYADGSFIALANAGEGPWTTSEIWTSTNGIDWQIEPAPITLRGVAFGNDRFVTVGDSGMILCSTNGINWTEMISPTKAPLYDVASGQEGFVAVGWAGTILSSTNGTDWVERTSGVNLDLRGVTFGSGLFVTVGSERVYRDPPAVPTAGAATSIVATSPNGIFWSLSPAIKNPGGAADIAFGNEKFIGVGGFTISSFPSPQLQTMTATNGTALSVEVATGLPSYNGSPILPAFALQKVAFGNGLFVASSTFSAFGYSEAVAISTNGSTWQQVPIGDGPGQVALWSGNAFAPVPKREVEGGILGMAFGHGTFLATSVGALFSSTNTITWNRRNAGVPVGLYDAAYGKGTFVAVGEMGTILQSGIFPDQTGPQLQNPMVIGGKFQVAILSQPGKEYTLEFSDDLRTGRWTPLSAIPGNGSTLILADPSSTDSRRFYRVVTR
jgi:uncharacterized delta-60 repeat protein